MSAAKQKMHFAFAIVFDLTAFFLNPFFTVILNIMPANIKVYDVSSHFRANLSFRLQ
jgi:hypothetical protein